MEECNFCTRGHFFHGVTFAEGDTFARSYICIATFLQSVIFARHYIFTEKIMHCKNIKQSVNF